MNEGILMELKSIKNLLESMRVVGIFQYTLLCFLILFGPKK